VVVTVFIASATVVLKHFAERSQIQTFDFVGEMYKKFYHKSIDIFCFIALANLLHKLLEVLLKDTAYGKESFPSKALTELNV